MRDGRKSHHYATRPLGFLTMPDRTGRKLEHVARLWALAALAVFAALAFLAGVPHSPSLRAAQVPIQLGLLVTVTIGAIAARRWTGLGGATLAVGGVGLGVFAAVAYHPLVAFLAAMVFVIPGVLLLLAWQRAKTMRALMAVAGALVILLTAGWVGSFRFYMEFFGSTHPGSSLEAPPVDLVEWVWSGALEPTSVTVNAKVVRDSPAVRGVVSESPDLADPIHSAPAAAVDDANNRVVSLQFDGLAPGTDYFYGIEVDGTIDRNRSGSFTTPRRGPFSFTVAVGSCARNGSNGVVFEAVRAANPLLYLAVGDLHYGDIRTNDRDLFRAALDETLTRPAQAALYQDVPVAYVWDDHDYGPNDADATSSSRPAALATYREYVPHYDLSAGGPDEPIYQAFTVGRVRFILTDVRSARDPAHRPDDPGKSLLGAAQKEWLKRELLDAAGRYPLIVWVNGVPWITPPSPGADSWAGYTTERRELADFVVAHGIDGLLMVGGDAHMIAIDDGSNADFSTSGGGGFPVFYAGALDRTGSLKGGPYSEGAYPGGGQFGLVTVNDDGGDRLTVRLSGRNWTGAEIVEYEFSVPAGADGGE